jgi:undecaprenyl-phosphate galactose phosphotransferase
MTTSKAYLISKRFFDIIFSLSVLVIGFPLFFFIALAIKFTSKGPIFYASKRVKKDLKLFNCWKFRTMYIDADERLEYILSSCPEKAREWELFYKLKEDPRITKIGAFLRKTSLDEIPQFFNVLKGDLSVVGPRPMALMKKGQDMLDELKCYLGEEAETILSIQPGITGLWQTAGRNTLTLKERAKYELEYVKKRNFWLDLRLILKTIPAMVNAKGAY